MCRNSENATPLRRACARPQLFWPHSSIRIASGEREGWSNTASMQVAALSSWFSSRFGVVTGAFRSSQRASRAPPSGGDAHSTWRESLDQAIRLRFQHRAILRHAGFAHPTASASESPTATAKNDIRDVHAMGAVRGAGFRVGVINDAEIVIAIYQ